MGETSTNIAMLNMNDALKVRVKDGCDVEDPCTSSPCPQHSRCHNAWDGYSCVCDKGGSPAPAPPCREARQQVAVLWCWEESGRPKLGPPPRCCGSAEA